MPPTEGYDWTGRKLLDRHGEEIGKLEALYADKETGGPEWAGVRLGRRGPLSLVPLAGARSAGEDVQVTIERGQVEGAPSVDPDSELPQADEERLYEHYGFDYSREESSTGLPVRRSGGGS